MIDGVDDQLERWCKEHAPNVQVTFTAPASIKGSAVCFQLFDLAPDATARSVKDPAPLKVKLGYLVSVWAEEVREMHRLLGLLVLAAMDNPDWEVEASPPLAIWPAFGLTGRPAFCLRVPFLRERPRRLVPKVRSHLVIKHSPMRSLHGRVLGPNQVAIMGASVELPSLRQATLTDHDGRFVFVAVPSEPPVCIIRVNAKGREVTIQPEQPLAPDRPLIIQLTESDI
jgi:hypothetical protein